MIFSLHDAKSLRTYLQKLSEAIGLDWLPILLDDRKFKKYPTVDSEIYWNFKDQQRYLTGDAIKTVVEELENHRDAEEKRQDTIEGKAFSLISLTGLASTLTIGLVEFMVSDHPLEFGPRIMILILYGLIGFSFLTTSILARRAIRVGKGKFMAPQISNLWILRDKTNEDYVLQEQAEALLRSYMNNMAIINDKASYVAAAQDWFRNTVVLLFFVPLLFSIGFGISPLQNATSVGPTNTPTSSTTRTNIPPLTATPPALKTIATQSATELATSSVIN